VRCIALAPSPNGRLIAAGADSGVVTLYGSVDAHSSASPEPIKEFLNLRTAITDMRFNATSELLAFSSKYVKSSLRVAHVRSRTVFSNWPTSKTPLNYVQCCAFSPRSGYLAMGNDKGKALMYRIAHYDSA
jgi:U3 small nucleolar RNA-associated protein 18